MFSGKSRLTTLGMWSVRIEDVDGHARQIWADELHFEGDVHVRGAFFLRPKRWLWVGPANATLLSGRIAVGEEKLLDGTSGSVDCTIPPFDPGPPVGNEVFRYISGAVRLDADIPNARAFDYYARLRGGTRFDGGRGAFHLDGVLRSGVVRPLNLSADLRELQAEDAAWLRAWLAPARNAPAEQAAPELRCLLEAQRQDLASMQRYLEGRVERLEASNQEHDAANRRLSAQSQELHETHDELRRTREELQATNAELRAILDSAVECLLVVDPDRHVRWVNRTFCETFGLTEADIRGKDLGDLPPRALECSGAAGATREPGSAARHERMSAGAHVSGRAGPQPPRQRVSDISPGREAERQIRGYQEKLRQLAFESALSEERQRRHIAADLHDRIGQALTGAQMKLQALRERRPSAFSNELTAHDDPNEDRKSRHHEQHVDEATGRAMERQTEHPGHVEKDGNSP